MRNVSSATLSTILNPGFISNDGCKTNLIAERTRTRQAQELLRRNVLFCTTLLPSLPITLCEEPFFSQWCCSNGSGKRSCQSSHLRHINCILEESLFLIIGNFIILACASTCNKCLSCGIVWSPYSWHVRGSPLLLLLSERSIIFEVLLERHGKYPLACLCAMINTNRAELEKGGDYLFRCDVWLRLFSNAKKKNPQCHTQAPQCLRHTWIRFSSCIIPHSYFVDSNKRKKGSDVNKRCTAGITKLQK